MKKYKAQSLTILVVLLTIIFILLGVIAYLVYQNRKPSDGGSNKNTKNITTYQECVDAGYPILESYPSRCLTPDGQSFTNPNQVVNPIAQVISVYFPKTTVDDPSKVYAVERTTDKTSTVENVSIEDLITGPTSDEKKLNYYTPIVLTGTSICTGKDFTLVIGDNKTATVQFCKSLKLDGELADARVITSVTKTLEQFSTITKVVVLDKNGNCVGDLSGMNSCLK